jgi:predicted short-subunit dehydrogenase-like oxidoreductase (DUF2520 family)
MRPVIETAFPHTGPIERRDWATLERHRPAIAERAPEVLDAYDALARLTRDSIAEGSAA